MASKKLIFVSQPIVGKRLLYQHWDTLYALPGVDVLKTGCEEFPLHSYFFRLCIKLVSLQWASRHWTADVVLLNSRNESCVCESPLRKGIVPCGFAVHNRTEIESETNQECCRLKVTNESVCVVKRWRLHLWNNQWARVTNNIFYSQSDGLITQLQSIYRTIDFFMTCFVRDSWFRSGPEKSRFDCRPKKGGGRKEKVLIVSSSDFFL